MLLLIHVVIAITSIVFTTYLFFAPSKSAFYVSYGLVGLTLGSGTYLVLSAHAPILSSCITGLAYIGIVLFGLAAARHKLANAMTDNDKPS